MDTGVSEQPIGVETVAEGARNRAEAAWGKVESRDYAVGIESGLFMLSGGKYYDVCACSIYDGETHNMGFSCAFEIPKGIMKFVHEVSLLPASC